MWIATLCFPLGNETHNPRVEITMLTNWTTQIFLERSLCNVQYCNTRTVYMKWWTVFSSNHGWDMHWACVGVRPCVCVCDKLVYFQGKATNARWLLTTKTAKSLFLTTGNRWATVLQTLAHAFCLFSSDSPSIYMLHQSSLDLSVHQCLRTLLILTSVSLIKFLLGIL